MGQCKSKTGALDNGLDIEGGVGGRKVTARRKWRKRKGYSLSASLEADLNSRESLEPGSRVTVGGGRAPREGSGPVLVSYNITRGDHSDLSITRENYSDVNITRGDHSDLCASHQSLLQPQVQQQNRQRRLLSQRRKSLEVVNGSYLSSGAATADLTIAEESETPGQDDDQESETPGQDDDKETPSDGADINNGSKSDINSTSCEDEHLGNAATPGTRGIRAEDYLQADHHSVQDHCPSSMTASTGLSGKHLSLPSADK